MNFSSMSNLIPSFGHIFNFSVILSRLDKTTDIAGPNLYTSSLISLEIADYIVEIVYPPPVYTIKTPKI